MYLPVAAFKLLDNANLDPGRAYARQSALAVVQLVVPSQKG